MRGAKAPESPATGTHTQSLALHIGRSWDEARFRTAELRPRHSAAALLTWTQDPPAIDAGVPAPVVGIVSEVAASLGPVAFRVFFPVDLPAGIKLHSAPKAWFPVALYRRLTRTWPADVAIAGEAGAAAEMFSQDWQLQGQIALVLSPEGLPDETLHRLRTARTWDNAPFPKGVRLLIAPAVDGDGILLVTDSASGMDQVLDLLSRAAAELGLSLRSQG
jgi:hypothetical protein